MACMMTVMKKSVVHSPSPTSSRMRRQATSMKTNGETISSSSPCLSLIDRPSSRAAPYRGSSSRTSQHLARSTPWTSSCCESRPDNVSNRSYRAGGSWVPVTCQRYSLSTGCMTYRHILNPRSCFYKIHTGSCLQINSIAPVQSLYRNTVYVQSLPLQLNTTQPSKVSLLFLLHP